jgi:tRNA(Ile)-lysidine synthase
LAAAIGSAEFDRLMSLLGPFEPKPQLAIAVSGGADSLALALLADAWVRPRGGSVTALTVDHGLRAEAAQEAREVKARLARRKIAHRILRWRGEKPRTNLQAAARAMRYRLLEDWCRKQGIIHLLLAHHRADQAETLLLRLGRGSGVDGLAAMAGIAETDHVRLLRPLLPIAPERLRGTLEAFGQSWIEDPSNKDPRHARVRLRTLMPALAREGLDSARLAATAARLCRARSALDDWTDRVLAAAVVLDPCGYAVLEGHAYLQAPADVALRALSHVLRTVGGRDYTPRLERLERLHTEIVSGLMTARTLVGCRILPFGPPTRNKILFCRELAAVQPEIHVRPGSVYAWDGRFIIALARRLPMMSGPLRLGPLGEDGWAELVAKAPHLRKIPVPAAVPAAVRSSLPALRDLDGLLAVPHLSYGRDGTGAGTVYVRHLAFRPLRPLAPGPVVIA